MKLAIEQAFSQFSEDYHDLKAIIQAVALIAAQGIHDAQQSADDGAFAVILGLNNLAEKMMEKALWKAAVNQKCAALESLETREVPTSRRGRSAEQSSPGAEAA
jgi:hypothetical protein